MDLIIVKQNFLPYFGKTGFDKRITAVVWYYGKECIWKIQIKRIFQSVASMARNKYSICLSTCCCLNIIITFGNLKKKRLSYLDPILQCLKPYRSWFEIVFQKVIHMYINIYSDLNSKYKYNIFILEQLVSPYICIEIQFIITGSFQFISCSVDIWSLVLANFRRFFPQFCFQCFLRK